MMAEARRRCRGIRRTARSRSRRGRRNAGTSPRIGTSIGTTSPSHASRRDTSTSRRSTSSSGMLAEKSVAHAFDGGLDVRKVDGDFVGEAFVGHRASVNDRERSPPCQGRQAGVKFGEATRIMPDDHEQRECPLCGTTMRLKETQTVTQIPGNPKPNIGRTGNGSVPIATTLRKPTKEGRNRRLYSMFSARRLSAGLLCAGCPRTPRSSRRTRIRRTALQ